MFFKWCNRLQYIGNRLPVYLNVEIQIQVWRVTSFHKMHCVINYMIMVIDYQWHVLNKKSRDVTFTMVFSRFSQGYNSSNGFLHQTWRVYKSKTLICIWISFENFWTCFLTSSYSSFAKKLSKFFVFQTLFFCKWEFCRKQKCAISFHSLLPLPKRIRQGLIAWILFVSLFFLFQKE